MVADLGALGCSTTGLECGHCIDERRHSAHFFASYGAGGRCALALRSPFIFLLDM